MPDGEDKMMTIPVPLVAPFAIEITQGGVQEVWDAFVKPDQESGEPQSVEMRCLMAILRAVHRGFDLQKEIPNDKGGNDT